MELPVIPQIFKTTCRRRAHDVALRQKKLGLWQDILWSRYLASAREIGSGLLSIGLKRGDFVSIIGDNCPEWTFIDMGVQLAGGVSVGIYSTSSWEQCKYIVNHSDSSFLFVENEEQLDKWLQFRGDAPRLRKVIVWDLKGLREFEDPLVISFSQLLQIGEEQEELQPEKLDRATQELTPDDVAIIVYTSGTTGPPKGAMLTHGNLSWISEAILRADPSTGIGPEDEVMSFLPLCHIFERLFSVVIHIRAGYVVSFIENLDTVTDNLREISPTIGYAVPRVWEKYYSRIAITMDDTDILKKVAYRLALSIGSRYSRRRLNGKKVDLALKISKYLAEMLVFRQLRKHFGMERMRIAFSGAAPISPDILTFFHSIGLNLVEGYGQTEGSGVTTITRLGQEKVGSVGQSLPGAELKIAEDGEILVRSPGVFKGYFKNPEATRETIVGGWLISGDIGEIDGYGYLTITDRKKDLIITAGGKNVAPQYIENKLKFSPYVHDAIVIGDRRKYLAGIIILDEDNVNKFAQDHKIAYHTYSDLCQNEEIIRLIQAEVDKTNKQLSSVEKIKKFSILPKRLYQEDDEVTPTMKVKRKSINESYGDLIESMYQ